MRCSDIVGLFLPLFVLSCGGGGQTQPAEMPLETPAKAVPTTAAIAETPTTLAPADTSALPLGEFRSSHPVFESRENPDGCETKVDDVLTIAAKGEGRIDVSLETYADFDHECSFKGELQKVDETHWTGLHEDQEEGACTLSLHYQGDQILVSSEECRGWCGARASMDGSYSVK